MLEKIKEFFVNIWKKFTDWVNGIFTSIKNWFINIGIKIKEVLLKVIEQIKKIINVVISAPINFVKWIGQWLVDKWAMIKNAFVKK